MDISSMNKNNFFLMVVALMSLLTVCFGVYENSREHAFRCDILDAKLQLNNYSPRDPDIRVTVIDTLGRVLSDSEIQDVSGMANHLDRKEVSEALSHGSGHDIKRTSGTNGVKYFYSATYIPEEGVVVRSSVPYSAPLTESLRKDYTFFFYTGGILVLFAVVMYLRYRLRSSEEEKMRIKRQLTENAAHELKTPAATIEGYLETLVSHPDMPSAQRESFISKCYTQSVRMSQLLSDMNTLTQLDYSSIVRPQTPLDICSVLARINDETSVRFSEEKIMLKMSLPQSLVIKGDPSLIYSLCRNIYDNALAYAQGARSFTVSAEAKGGYALLSFADDGKGVPPEHLPHIFERFYRVDKGRSRRLGGTGLGLSIVKNIAAQYGGSVTASQTPGGGLTIDVRLKMSV